MMRSKILVLLLTLVLSLVTLAVYAEESEVCYGIDAEKVNYQETPINKLGRGLINTATCWTEVVGKASEVSDETDPAMGATLGVAEGTVTAILRGATGLFETLTFFIPPYNQPVMQPEYAYQDADQKLKDFLW